jgi:hypothetical protein
MLNQGINYRSFIVRLSILASAACWLGVLFAPSVTCQAQQFAFESQSGKAWRTGDPTEANMVQLIVSNVRRAADGSVIFSGKVSIRNDNDWNPESEEISGTCELHGQNLTFHGTAQTLQGTVTVRGYHIAGANKYDASDDSVFIYYFNDFGPENGPCDPDDEVLEEQDQISP